MPTSQNIQETYDKFSSCYDIFFKSYLEKGREKAVSTLAPHPKAKVLEIGIGTGLGIEYYPSDINLFAFDYSQGMLKVSKQKALSKCKCPVNLLQMDAQRMAFADNSFDYVLAAYVLTVVPRPQVALDEIFRVAKPGARVVIVNHLRSNNKVVGAIEDFLNPLFSGIGLFSLNQDIKKLIRQKHAKNISIQPTSFLKTHHILSFNTPCD